MCILTKIGWIHKSWPNLRPNYTFIGFIVAIRVFIEDVRYPIDITTYHVDLLSTVHYSRKETTGTAADKVCPEYNHKNIKMQSIQICMQGPSWLGAGLVKSIKAY